MAFQVSALPEHEFAELFAFDERELGQRGARRYVADCKPGFPCRVSLEDASPGETVILTPFAHLPPDSPYRSTGPVFVRQGARRAAPAVDEVPELLRLRLLSVRAYDGESLMQDAEVVEGRDLEGVIRRFFADRRVSYLHVHFARPGCYACRIDRAEHGSVPRV